MEQWQLQQRALKEAERRSKQESLELHKQFRGGVNEEDLKLRAIKEEERLRKIETESILHDYKGGIREEDLKLAAWRNEDRQKKLEAIEHHHGYRLSADDIEKREKKQRDEQNYPLPEKGTNTDTRDSIEHGAVNRLMENFNSPGASIVSPPVNRYSISGMVEQISPPLMTEDEEEYTIPQGTVQSIASNLDDRSPLEPADNFAVETAPSADLTSTEKAAMYFDADVLAPKVLYVEPTLGDGPDDASLVSVIPPNADHSTSQGLAAVSVTTAANAIDDLAAAASELDTQASDYEITAAEAAGQISSEPEPEVSLTQGDAATSVSNAMKPQSTIATSHQVEIGKQEHSNTIRLDVKFSFGVISSREKPELSGYMQAVEQEVQSWLRQSSDAAHDVLFDGNHAPYVKDIQVDGK
jgi:hypothetical protein